MSKCQLLEVAMEEVKYPDTLEEWRQAWSKLLWTVKKEPNLRILDRTKFDKLMELTGGNAQAAGAFFYDFNIEDKPDYTVIPIAVANDCIILSFKKNSDGQYIEFFDGQTAMRFGKTYIIDNKRYTFYRTNYVYIDYHNTTGTPRRTKIGVDDEKWYNEDGTREYFHYSKKIVKAISKVFNNS